MKAAPLLRVLEGTGHEVMLLHTGQHYDDNMSKAFFDDLGMPKPDVYLGVGSGTHAEQTAAVMVGFEKLVREVTPPDMAIVVGDVNSTVAVALVAAKSGIALAHVEAGLRSGDWAMPEEINRVVTDRLSDLMFTPSADGDENLRREGVPEHKIHRVGNIMIDSLVGNLEKARGSGVLSDLDLAERGYAVLTLHRPSNVDSEEDLLPIMGAVHQLAESIPVVFSCHPRTAQRLDQSRAYRDLAGKGDLRQVPSMGYLDFLHLTSHSRMVLTDSGGLQEETTYLQIPCLTIRSNTERPITITEGTNLLVGPDPKRILEEGHKILSEGGKVGSVPELWDGKTAQRIVEVLDRYQE
jgi:UDP-N-acetylglucosamine 2-epimerase (non-hydrolysing)